MLQQIGLNVRRGHKGDIVLCGIPKRIPASPTSHTEEHIAQECAALLHTILAIIAYPFVRVGRALKFLAHPGSDSQYKRSPIPARKAGNSQNILQDFSEEYEAEQERLDALSKLNDQLPAGLTWMIMELFPMRIKKQKAIIREVESISGFKWT